MTQTYPTELPVNTKTDTKNRFKVGDWVRVKANAKDYLSANESFTDAIERMIGSKTIAMMITRIYNNDNNIMAGSYRFTSEMLELAESTNQTKSALAPDATYPALTNQWSRLKEIKFIPVTEKFKVGDRVRVTKNAKAYSLPIGSTWHTDKSNMIGSIYSIGTINGNEIAIDGFLFAPEMLELVPESTDQTKSDHDNQPNPESPAISAEKQKFKIGDRVRIKPNAMDYLLPTGLSWKHREKRDMIGSIYAIDGYIDDHYFINKYWFSPQMLELVPESMNQTKSEHENQPKTEPPVIPNPVAETQKFKVGDRVRIKENAMNYPLPIGASWNDCEKRAMIGSIYTIDKIGVIITINNYCFTSEMLELVAQTKSDHDNQPKTEAPATPVAEMQKFKIGDRVRIKPNAMVYPLPIGTSWRNHDKINMIGSIYTIDEYNGKELLINKYLFAPEMLELVPESTNQTKSDTNGLLQKIRSQDEASAWKTFLSALEERQKPFVFEYYARTTRERDFLVTKLSHEGITASYDNLLLTVSW